MNTINNIFIIRASIAPLYSGPSFTSSKISEVVSGEQVKIHDTKGNWLNVIQGDGYRGWVKDFYGTFENNLPQCNYIVIDKHPLPFGSRVQKIENQYKTVNGDDYRFSLEPVKIGEIIKFDILISYARSLIGCPYRWGGKTSGGFDCSGLVQTIFLLSGLLLPRDSWQQSEFFKDSFINGEKSKPGDLHFFGRDGKISHVGISTGGLNLIHCQGWVKEESFSDNISGNKNLADMYMHTCSVELNLE